MELRNLRRAAMIVAGLVVVLAAGGCSLTFEGTLPNDLAAAIQRVLDAPADFAQDADAPGGTGTVVDDLAGVPGCWGAYIPALAGQGVLGQMDLYSTMQLEADGTMTTWDIVDNGGLFATVYDGIGSYEPIGDHRFRFTIDRRRYYNAFRHSYEVYEDSNEVIEWLATLEGDRLYLRALDEPGAATPDPNEPDYTMVYHRFDCPE